MCVFSKFCRLSFIILLMGCAVAKADMGEIESIFPKEASAMHTGQKAVIVDVREDIKNRITLPEL